MKMLKNVCLLTLLGLSSITYASSNFIIKNDTHAAIDENEYANVEMIVGNWLGGVFKVPQNSTQEFTITYKDIPIHLSADILFRNAPIANKQNCSHAFDTTKALTTLVITADQDPVTANSTITCQWIEV